MATSGLAPASIELSRSALLRLRALPALLLALLVAAPVVAVLLQAGGDPSVWRHLARTVLAEYVTNSLLLVAGVALLTGVMGSGCAWLVAMYRFPGRELVAWALFLPLSVPAYVLAYAYTDLLDVTGPVQTAIRALTGWSVREFALPDIRSLPGAVFVLSLALYPYVYALARAAFLEQSQCALEVSRTLGCSGLGAFGRVGLPLARPAIAAGLSFVAMETLADFGAVGFFGVPTFTTGIYRAWFGLGSPEAAAQLSSVLLAAVGLVLLAERLLRGQARFAARTVHLYRRNPPRLRGAAGWLALAACTLPWLLGFVLPGAALLAMALERRDAPGPDRLLELAANTLSVGLTAAAVVVAVALLALLTARRAGPLAQAALRVAVLGYAVPGAVIGVGLLVTLGAFDHALNALGLHRGLLLSGTQAALVYGYLVRFFAVAYNPLEAGVARIAPHMGEAARILGHGQLATFVRIHLPLLRPHLLSAALLVLVDVMKELPATLVLRPFDFDTLAVETWRLATTERLAGAAVPSLLIVAAGLLPVIVLVRTSERKRRSLEAQER